MLYFTKAKDMCTGCSACYAACPVNCITMQQDAEGFLYPVASDACIHCGKCEKVCPIQHTTRPEPDVTQKAFAAVTRDNAVWRQSASGGAFSEICRAWDDDGALIAGAAWDTGFRVHHICVQGAEQITPLRKSKYIASDLEDTFPQLKKHLQAGGKAVFCGTPCQVAGLRTYLGKEYDGLLLIDLICHGVGSPKVFSACMDAIGKQLNIQVSGYEFRAKRRIHETDYLSKVILEKGSKSVYFARDPYTQLFLSQRALRPSCSTNCRFRHKERQGDLTIADFKGLEKVFPELIGSKKNYSAVVANSAKGMAVASDLQKAMEMHICAIDVICAYNPLFCKQTEEATDRDLFFTEFVKQPDAAIEKWTKPCQVCPKTVKNLIHEFVPTPLRRAVINLIKKVKAL